MRLIPSATALVFGSLQLLGGVGIVGINHTTQTTTATSLSSYKQRGSFPMASKNGSYGRSTLNGIANTLPNDTGLSPISPINPNLSFLAISSSLAAWTKPLPLPLPPIQTLWKFWRMWTTPVLLFLLTSWKTPSSKI